MCRLCYYAYAFLWLIQVDLMFKTNLRLQVNGWKSNTTPSVNFGFIFGLEHKAKFNGISRNSFCKLSFKQPLKICSGDEYRFHCSILFIHLISWRPYTNLHNKLIAILTTWSWQWKNGAITFYWRDPRVNKAFAPGSII